ncbi:VPLPA-CTERM sorting domain-containing protein [Methylotuvimicrobium sp. KM1]|uniref:VPLPA-CTERM sorting domain-containing protein n=1 Tax=Methylotuvimicrobium sp. KM1 TaxID=3377707 RepID=UPI00385166A3
MKHLAQSLAVVGLISGLFMTPAQAASTLPVEGIIYKVEEGTTFDTWKIVMQSAGTFKVNLLAYESTSNSLDDAVDLNGDGRFTYLDPDTHFYLDNGSENPLLNAANHLARCDDINNNCNSISNDIITLNSLSEEEGAANGSIHFRRDPAFEVTLAEGSYLYLVADYRLTTDEAAAGINLGDSIRNNGDDGNYRIDFSSDTMAFSRSGNTITVSAVPLPGAVWLFGSALLGGLGMVRRNALWG